MEDATLALLQMRDRLRAAGATEPELDAAETIEGLVRLAVHSGAHHVAFAFERLHAVDALGVV